MALFHIPLWKEAPFIRLILPFTAGILLQYYLDYPFGLNWAMVAASLPCMFIFSFAPIKIRFYKLWIYGLLLNCSVMACGGLFTHYKDPFATANLLDNIADSTIFIVSLEEQLSEKPASWKALASILSVHHKKKQIYPNTNINLYFRKSSTLNSPGYGDQIAFIKSPQKIKNSPLQAGFDYKQYCALRNIHLQVFLNPDEFVILPAKNKDPLTGFLISLRVRLIQTLKKYIPGKKECGLAEALLIGYKDDLDKNLIQSYSNTGVVHVVAISGLHLGLIYAILKYFCFPFKKKTFGRWLSPIIIISGLWLFSLLAGGSPSVLRSAVMFTSIVLGEFISRRSSLINNLGASAFFLLCYNPFWLWDAGFILSYSALLSIVVFMKPLYDLLAFKNKISDAIWKLNAVTLSAQVLTMPVIIYYFKQFPTLFLITNFVAIPLSSIILIGEIILSSVGFLPSIAAFAGLLVSKLISGMNNFVEYMDGFPFSSVRLLEINFLQLILLYVFISFCVVWLILHNRHGLPAALVTAIIFFAIQALKIWQ